MALAKKLIVGVDYGTTYSGVSYVWSDASSIKDINLITEWTGHGRPVNWTRKKVPSRISYEGPDSWGYNIKPNELAYAWTKLLLDKVRLMEFDDENLRNWEPGLLALPPGKTAEDVVTDFLTKLYRHITDLLERKMSREVLDVTDIEFWFSMPAIWSDKAQMSTMAAARKAGFGTRANDSFCMIREPEAAAIACLNGLISDSPSSLVRMGEGVLICDCGGGTVDISSYEVIRPSPRLQLHETCVSIGGKCGSTTIDRAFYALLRKRFGAAFDRIPQKKKGAGSPLMQQFEDAKKDFGHGPPTETFRFILSMNVPNSNYYEREEEEDGFFRGEVILTHDDMAALFEPVVSKVKALLDNQIRVTERTTATKIKTIILAGGLGESRHLFTELRNWCPADVIILNPPGSWEAICKGAALRGLEGSLVPRRKCPRHYGISILKPFREGVDSDAVSCTNPFTGEKQARGYMEWILEKGENIHHDTIKSHSFQSRVSNAAAGSRFDIEFFISNMALAPAKQDHPSVEKVGILKVDLSDVDLSLFQARSISRGNGFTSLFFGSETIHAIGFQIHITAIDESIGVMDFKVLIQGKTRGSVALRFMEEHGSNPVLFE